MINAVTQGKNFFQRTAATSTLKFKIASKMNIYTTLFAVSDRAHSFVAARMAIANCAAHDLAHCYRVANLSYQLAFKEHGASPTVAFYGGLLHDVLDSKLYGGDDTESTEKELRSILLEDDRLPNDAVVKIVEIIHNVGYKNIIRPRTDFDPWALSLEYRCVQDADLLDAIGAIGVARCMSFSGKNNRKLFGKNLAKASIVVNREAYLQSQKTSEASAIGHFFEKLLRIKDHIMTVEGKRLGQQRHSNMISFLQQLDAELSDAMDESSGAIAEGLQSFM